MDTVRASRRGCAALQHDEIRGLKFSTPLVLMSREAMSGRTHILSAAFLTVFLLTPSLAQACSCVRIAPDGFRRQAAVIIEGKVQGIKREGGINGRVIARIAVSKRVKGEAPRTVTVTTRGNSAACGVNLTKGQVGEFLLARENGRFSTNLCLMIGARR